MYIVGLYRNQISMQNLSQIWRGESRECTVYCKRCMGFCRNWEVYYPLLVHLPSHFLTQKRGHCVLELEWIWHAWFSAKNTRPIISLQVPWCNTARQTQCTVCKIQLDTLTRVLYSMFNEPGRLQTDRNKYYDTQVLPATQTIYICCVCP